MIFSDGKGFAKLSQVGGKKHRLAMLEARFGDWKSYEAHRKKSGGFDRQDALDRDELSEIERRLSRRRERDRDDDGRIR